jgi:hypothetical protein
VRRRVVLGAALALAGALAPAAHGARAAQSEFPGSAAAPPWTSRATTEVTTLALPSPWPSALVAPSFASADQGAGSENVPKALWGERAQVLLRSMTIPGWGQAMLGHNTSATVFALADLAIWASYAAFRVQETMRMNSSTETARLFAGIDLSGRDDSFRRNVGAYPSSDLYNIYVVRREAANLYFGDPAAYNAYIAAHQLTGTNSWYWVSEAAFDEYRDQRQSAQEAAKRANTALAFAVANRMISALHAARLVQAHEDASAARWRLDYVPSPDDPTSFQIGVSTRF